MKAGRECNVHYNDPDADINAVGILPTVNDELEMIVAVCQSPFEYVQCQIDIGEG